ncbi:hypothetical protein T03_7091 [Trichinella britovi]|uniref:Uncharacterized protein n=2 Tax=Trichinella TaxID=6333 RepID=A0A0V1CSG5_TRIBR|nr:hypothetical protein T12_10898 [Trichinella patagoniensis]KRY52151.1 hypothetical protein T03_7091 [Trichinella britovi]KRZ97266.1 hypothetical protein T08_11157 [Trichinella sp. T8]
MEEENKRSAPAVPSSKLEHVKLLEDESFDECQRGWLCRTTADHRRYANAELIVDA